MEIWKVIAIDTQNKITFRSEGKTIEGAQFLLQDPNEPCTDRTRFRGFKFITQFISNDRLGKLGVLPQPGDTIQLIFNRYGDIEQLSIVE